jgi:hypothetical protein
MGRISPEILFEENFLSAGWMYRRIGHEGARVDA